MKVSFDENGTLCIDAENNTDRMALMKWEDDGGAPLVRAQEHLKTTVTYGIEPFK